MCTFRFLYTFVGTFRLGILPVFLAGGEIKTQILGESSLAPFRLQNNQLNFTAKQGPWTNTLYRWSGQILIKVPFENSLREPDITLTGSHYHLAIIPLLPFVIVGRSRRYAWER